MHFLGLLMLIILGMLFLRGSHHARLPASSFNRISSYAVSNDEITPLSEVLQEPIAAHPGLSGFHLITSGHKALLCRLDMIEAATRSLDIQYYSIQNDKTGKLLIEALLRAGDRGVRVRMLIDDITIQKTDILWQLVNQHPQIEMRLFNPFATRDQSLTGRLRNGFFGLTRFNRRMHNKLLVADNQICIIGGRNLGDAYFASSTDFEFRDADIFVAGPMTQQASAVFDRFWNSMEAFPLHALVKTGLTPEPAAELRRALADHRQLALAQGLIPCSLALPLQLRNEHIPLVWAEATLAADYPVKVESSAGKADSRPADALHRLADSAKEELIMATSYFVPGTQGVEWLRTIRQRGVKIRILTNSLGSTDVIAVHTGYSRYRRALLTLGAELYEMKRLPGKYPSPGRFSRSSRASLHTKIYIADRRTLMVGTYNLDPRSTHLNTEMALIIHNTILAEELAEIFCKVTSSANSWRVTLAGRGSMDLQWHAEENGAPVCFHRDPKAGIWRNIISALFSLLPWENQL